MRLNDVSVRFFFQTHFFKQIIIKSVIGHKTKCFENMFWANFFNILKWLSKTGMFILFFDLYIHQNNIDIILKCYATKVYIPAKAFLVCGCVEVWWKFTSRGTVFDGFLSNYSMHFYGTNGKWKHNELISIIYRNLKNVFEFLWKKCLLA